MKINFQNLSSLLQMLHGEQLLADNEMQLASGVTKNNFPFAPQLFIADSIHYHIHVPDIALLPHQLLLNKGGTIVNRQEGYIKYSFPGAVNLIFSHIEVAQKEQIKNNSDHSYLDHIGIDIRSKDKEAYIIFQQIPFLAAQNDYYFKRQGDGVDVVKCCHMQVKEKYWVYAGKNINYEFAFGPLVIHEDGFRVDIRPVNPFNKPEIEQNESCCAQTKSSAKIYVS
jgi:hypothetical protein